MDLLDESKPAMPLVVGQQNSKPTWLKLEQHQGPLQGHKLEFNRNPRQMY